MATPKKYFHDRAVLLLLSISAFLAVLGSLLILLRLDSSRSSGYIVQYRANVGINEFKTGGVVTMLSFVVYLGMVLVLHAVLSKKVYPLRRHVAIAILGLGVLLLIMGVVVSHALLILR